MGKITSYPPDSSPTGDDIIITVDGSTGSNRKVTISNLLTFLFNNIPGNAVTTAKLSTDLQQGWENAYGTTTFPAPNSVVCNGNRNYTLTFNAIDLTGVLSAGMRLRTTRATQAPTQSTSLNGSSQYFSKTAPAGMTWTDDFVVSFWAKISSYSTQRLVSRWNGTSGWIVEMNSSGQISMFGNNAGASNFSQVTSYQSLPSNRWVYVTLQLDMSAFTATPTTSYVMLDGVDVPAFVTRGGTNPTALVQAGDLQIGAANGATFYGGKLAQVAISSAKIAQANILTLLSQGLTSAQIAANSIASAYSFNNDITDLNTTSANNLTANSLATANNTDSPFGGQASGSISSTLDYAIISKVAFSTNTTVTVQVPEGCTIPTSASGVSAVYYSGIKAPYGMPVQRGKWTLQALDRSNEAQANPTTSTWYNVGSFQLSVPIGEWMAYYNVGANITHAGSAFLLQYITLSTTSSTESDKDFSTYGAALASSQSEIFSNTSKMKPISVAATQIYYLNTKTETGTTTNLRFRGDISPSLLVVENALL